MINDDYNEYINSLKEKAEKYNKSCFEYIINQAWELYCQEAGMCAGAVDYWEQVSTEVQDMYICRIVRNNLK